MREMVSNVNGKKAVSLQLSAISEVLVTEANNGLRADCGKATISPR